MMQRTLLGLMYCSIYLNQKAEDGTRTDSVTFLPNHTLLIEMSLIFTVHADLMLLDVLVSPIRRKNALNFWLMHFTHDACTSSPDM